MALTYSSHYQQENPALPAKDESPSREAQRLDRTREERRTHIFHAISKDIVAECATRNVGTIAVGDL
ncbi:MAG: transposase, partial [Halapricum sp.]